MQRSRRALLQRRDSGEVAVSGRKKFYKVSLSVFIVSWVLMILLSTSTSRGNSFRDADGLGGVFQKVDWQEVENDKTPDSQNLLILGETGSNGDSSSSGNDENQDNQSSKEQGKLQEDSDSENEEEPKRLSRTRSSTYTHQKQTMTDSSDVKLNDDEKNLPKNDRLSRVTPPRLDQFKSKTATVKEKSASDHTGSVIRVDPSGKEYNYASASKGAKVLAYNKEAKGPSNILGKDKDKYLRNPCSAEEKYIIIELSEETLVATIQLANFEHYSSNFKEFELYNSLVYPTENWNLLRSFTAINVKHAQRFELPEPKWARYLKLSMLSHYGSEFYCTLSVLQVYGVDAVEKMLEDLINVQDNLRGSEEATPEQPSMQDHVNDDDAYRDLLTEIDSQSGKDLKKPEPQKGTSADPLSELRRSQIGRVPGDTVLKILMQKVHLMDVNLAVMERYLEELNGRYGQIFKDIDNDIVAKDSILGQILQEIKNFQDSNDIFLKNTGDLLRWRSIIASEMERLIQENANLRSEVETVIANQVDLENKGLAVILISFVFCCFAALMLLVDILLSICQIFRKSETFSALNYAWFILLLVSSVVIFVLAL